MIASTGELTAEARDAHKIVPNVTFRYGLGDSAVRVSFDCGAMRARWMDSRVVAVFLKLFFSEITRD